MSLALFQILLLPIGFSLVLHSLLGPNFIEFTGIFKKIPEIHPKGCTILFETSKNVSHAGPVFCEDIKPDGDKIWASCDANRHQWNTVMGTWNRTAGEIEHGQIWLLSSLESTGSIKTLAGPNLAFGKFHQVELKGRPNVFHPLGILPIGSPSTHLLVINHRLDDASIELFKIESEKVLTHVTTIEHSLIFTPNSLLLTEFTSTTISYYVTNDHYFRTGPKKFIIENFGRKPWSNAIHCTTTNYATSPSTTCNIVAIDLSFANGITHSPDYSHVFIAETLAQQVRVFKRNLTNNYLLPIGKIKIPMAVDNVELYQSGDSYSITVGGHPKTLGLISWVKGGKGPRLSQDLSKSWQERRLAKHAPSMIVECPISKLPTGPSNEILNISCKTLFSDPGTFFGTSSTGLITKMQGKETLVVSGLYDTGILTCPLE